jgi:hypothetical protein
MLDDEKQPSKNKKYPAQLHKNIISLAQSNINEIKAQLTDWESILKKTTSSIHKCIDIYNL